MPEKCPGITKSGQACKGSVKPGDTWCKAHDPARSEQRQASASRAGRARRSEEFREVKALLRKLADDVLSGAQDARKASICSQILGVWVKTAEAESRLKEIEEARIAEVKLKAREQMELVGRLESLEDQLARQKQQQGGWVS